MKLNSTQKQLLILGACCALVVLVVHCRRSPIYFDDPYATVEVDTTAYEVNTDGLPPPNYKGNAPTVGGVELGRRLFYEKALSRDNSISCASCHKQENAFSDPAQFSEGVDSQLGERQAMALFNLAYHNQGFFWDGRAATLHEQALMPIEDPVEMDESLERVIAKLDTTFPYPNAFLRAFGDSEITKARIGLALEQFLFTLVSNNSKYDQYLRGDYKLTESEERGFLLYFSEYNPSFPEVSGAHCDHCHSGYNLANELFTNNGLDAEFEQSDEGRYRVTNAPEDMAKFKVPSLRNIAVSGPYMHDGRFETLEEVIDHYDHGLVYSSTLDEALEYTMQTGLMLDDQEKADLLAFLQTLTDESFITNPEHADPNP